ncbi:hypothetical protein NXY11_00415 [Parabacteroides faecis]|uniref:hypothetical protein n=1 Tax=Parabacteroides faecis TaxID=1217282 RepID=UPI0021644068|nr:hypothetical protein [Parabacteroides faecis]MCS2894659.1 hypothetical protein [Parabacteroides faecis]UVQ46754.1 hypothetical protein NXY11_00415 [Parabacteroides faecis]
MKTYRFFTAILMVALCFNFVSCGDDDDNGGETGKSTKRLTKIVTTSDNKEYATIQFTYSGDKVSSIKIKADSDDELIVSEKEITSTSTNSTYELGSNGYIVDDGSDEYTYYSEGYLKSIGSDKFIYDANWNLITTDWADHISYTEIPNKDNLFLVLDDDPIGNDRYVILAQAGFVGKASPFLPQTVTWDGDNETYTFKYEIDNDGHINKVTVVYTYENGDTDSWTQVYTYEEVK